MTDFQRAKTDLRPAQDRTATHFYEHDAVQAVIGMGGGKTAAAMTAIRELVDDKVIRCALVIAPKRVAQLVWMREHLLWAHLAGLKIRHVAGGPLARLEALLDKGQEPADIYVVGIDNTQWLVDELKKLKPDHKLFDRLCIDELSRFRNPRSKRAKALMKVIDNFGGIWGLTGTPRPNGYEDQYKPLSILTKNKIWGRSFDRWRKTRFMPDDYKETSWSIRDEWLERTKEDISRFSITIGEEEMPYLDPITNVVHWVDLPPRVMEMYKTMERKLLAETKDGTVLAANAAVASGKLAQIAQGFMYGDDLSGFEVTHLHTAKADMLADLYEGVGGEPVLVSYEFKEDLHILQEMWPGMPYFGAGVSDAKALENEARWNRRELPILGLHPASAGHGLNLQYGGSQLILYGMPWSAELYDQMLKRFHRPGQTRRCFAHHIFARGTVDEVKHDRVIRKMSDQEAFRKYLRKI